MKKTYLYLAASHAAILILGLLGGRWLSKKQPLSELQNDAPHVSADPIQKRLALEADPAFEATKRHTQQVEQRLAALKWLKKRVGYMSVPAFFATGDLNPVFVEAFDLTSSQAAELQAKLREARVNLSLAAMAVSTTSVDPSHQRLVVDVPAIAVKGTDVYKGVLDAFKDVLGPGKFEDFNELAGDDFDQSFDAFGARARKYEVTAAVSGNDTFFTINESYVGPEANGSSMSRLSSKDIERYFPLVYKLIPADFGARQKIH